MSIQTLFPAPAVLVLLAVAAPAFSWGPDGHRVVGLIAGKHLSESTAQKVNDLLDDHSVPHSCRQLADAGKKLACVANWADDVRNSTHRNTYNWHFVDISLKNETYDPERDCEPEDEASKGKCGLVGLDHVRAILRGEVT